MSGEKNSSLVTAKPQPPSISIVVSFQPRPGCSGHHIVSRATVTHQGNEHEAAQSPRLHVRAHAAALAVHHRLAARL